MKVFELLNAFKALESLKVRIEPGEEGQPDKVLPAKLPAKLMYAITKNQRLMEPDLKAYDAGYLAILEGAGIKMGDPIPEDKKEEMDKQYQELVHTEVEFKPYQIDLQLLDGIDLDYNQMNAIYWMVKE